MVEKDVLLRKTNIINMILTIIIRTLPSLAMCSKGAFINANPSIFFSKSRFSVLVNERMIGVVSDFISLGEGITYLR